MIARLWRGSADHANAEAYARHFQEAVAPALARLTGSKGAWLLSRKVDGQTEFLAVTLWESPKAIRAFAGDVIEKAHVEPEARAVLAKFDDVAEHYEVDCPAQSPRRIDLPA